MELTNFPKRYKYLSLNFSKVSTLEGMHLSLMEKFGFPDFYGNNIHALIDCWSSLRYPSDGMTNVTIENDEILLLEVRNLSNSSKEIISNLMIAIENVNSREINIGKPPCIIIIPTK